MIGFYIRLKSNFALSKVKNPKLAKQGKLSYECARSHMQILDNTINRLKKLSTTLIFYRNFKLLQKNVYQNNFSQNVTLHNTAVSNFIGTSKLYLQKNNTGGHQLGFDPFQTNNSIEVPVTKINLDKIDFAKIDVEGSELNVLKGMKVLPKKLLIEFSPQKLQNIGTKLDDFFKFIEKFSIKEVSKNGLIEADFDKLRKINYDANLFLY